ncbi:MAG: flippase-like domain-containing protein, partial [Candidatus Eisenbacteria bacterium]|nr:flippase-like domain-containing protein [Candidatus Eisenbacteria bacterium]
MDRSQPRDPVGRERVCRRGISPLHGHEGVHPLEDDPLPPLPPLGGLERVARLPDQGRDPAAPHDAERGVAVALQARDPLRERQGHRDRPDRAGEGAALREGQDRRRLQRPVRSPVALLPELRAGRQRLLPVGCRHRASEQDREDRCRPRDRSEEGARPHRDLGGAVNEAGDSVLRQADESPRRPVNTARDWLRLAAVAAVTVLVFFFIFRDVSFAAVGEILREARFLPLVAGFAITLAFPPLSAARWRCVMEGMGCRIALRESMGLVLASWTLSIFTPSKGGDLAKAYFLRGRFPVSSVLGSVLAVRLVDTLVLLAFCLA